ncbi:DUF3106 domain-containing protein [Cognatilysobacter terrigena]|uniref:DUF3106 domain-containing protein n=1 Tax=Cognatilysobacter terrigena TaxID=2488749 RepID=UPI001414DCBD|nr:DUF3106 domain-containing protein [Lysobacter terrigena]
MRRRHRAALLVGALLAGGWAGAQALPDDLQDVAALLQPLQRAALQTHARIWSTWSAAQRAAFTARADAWDRLPPSERGERRADWQAWRELPQDEQARVRAAAAQYAAMDVTTRQALRTEFDTLDLSERHGWRLGPVLGADYPRLQPLLAQVPPDERVDLLRTLRAMTAEDRDRLAVLVQRTPPQSREALRRDLMSTSDANRAAWLMLRLER